MKSSKPTLGAVTFRGMTPMLDTLFILLFALLALSDAREVDETEEVRIELPEVEPGSEATAPTLEVFSISIDAESQVRIQGEEAVVKSLAQIDEALAASLGDSLPEEVVIEILADHDARHGVTVELLQHLRLRGFQKVQLLAIGVTEGGPLASGNPAGAGAEAEGDGE